MAVLSPETGQALLEHSMNQLILASASPRRKELLTQLGYSFSVSVSGVEEMLGRGELPQDYVMRLAEHKAQSIVAKSPNNCVVLGADTIVVIGDEILEKPRDFTDAQRMLRLLSGQCHQVITGVAVVSSTQKQVIAVPTDVWFKALTDEEIVEYWSSGEPQDKAGSYGIQGLGGKFVTRIEGSYHAVVGLPLFETAQLLRKFMN